MSAEDQWWYGLQHQPVSDIRIPEVASKLKNWGILAFLVYILYASRKRD